jgi:hypothetical protein
VWDNYITDKPQGGIAVKTITEYGLYNAAYNHFIEMWSVEHDRKAGGIRADKLREIVKELEAKVLELEKITECQYTETCTHDCGKCKNKKPQSHKH